MSVLPWLSLVLWLPAFAFLSPSALRLYRGAHARKAADEWRAVAFFSAGLFLAFNVRRLFMPADDQAIIGLYLLSISLAVFSLILLGQERP